MNIKKKFFLISVILFFGFFGVLNLAQAGCCKNTCEVASNPSECIPNTEFENDCSFANAPKCNAKCCKDGSDCVPNTPGHVCTSGDSLENNCEFYKAPQTIICDNIAPPASGNVKLEFPNPITPTNLSDMLQEILNHMRGIVLIIAVIFIIIGGIMLMTSSGSEKMATAGKKTVTYAVVGLIIALAAPAFLTTILQILGANGVDDTVISGSMTIRDIAIKTLEFLLSVFGIFAIISLLIGGILYLNSYGNEKRIDLGKKMVTYAIIGIIVGLSSLVIVKQIDTFLK